MSEHVVVVVLEGRAALREAELGLARAIEGLDLDVQACATVRRGYRGTIRIRHGLRWTRSQEQALRLMATAALLGVGAELLTDQMRPLLSRRIHRELLTRTASHLRRGQAALALVVGGDTPLLLAEALRPAAPAVLLTSFAEQDEELFRALLG